MQKEIKYNGFSAVPSDYESADGDLAASLNIVPEDGALVTVGQPETVLRLQTPKRVISIHSTSAFSHYIILDPTDNSLSWLDSGSIDPDSKEPTTALTTLPDFDTQAGIYGIETVGNTLVVLTADAMHYLLWKGKDEGYLYLGTHLPECPISFGLQGEVVRSDEFSISFDKIAEGDIFKEFSDSNKTRISDQVLAKVNKFIAEHSTDKGRFIYPFLVRYAYRLYDGSLTMHSAPVLMIASSDLAPQVFWSHITGKGSYTDAKLYIVAVEQKLDYAVINASRLEDLRLWKDIVRSVDVFVSKPIYTYDQNGKCERFTKSEQYGSYCVCKHTNQKADTAKFPLRYQKRTFNELYAFTFDPQNLKYPSARLMIPRRSADTVKEDIRSVSQFYLLESVKLEQLATVRTPLNVEEDYLQSLLTREVMTDDYDSHDRLIPRYAFAYNARLNMANLRKVLYDSFNAGAQFAFTDGYVMNGSMPGILDSKISYCVFFFIKQDGRDIVVQGESYMLGNLTPTLFLFYPNVNAYKAVIVEWNSFPSCHEVQLEQHSFLNGAFFFGGWDDPAENATTPTASSDEDRIVDVPNKIYTSEVNNPFYFPVKGINTVGTGAILGISSAVKALSEGQFGQFPLYAFTSEGVWALEVSSSGTYSARQPVTRDVCVNSGSITQIDSAVLFATERGIMLISGSTSVCISDSLDADTAFSMTQMPYSEELLEKNGMTAADVSVIPFKDFIKECRMIYDYTNQRIVVYNPEQPYAYVYSLKSKAWGMMQSTIGSSVSSYPEALAMDKNGSLVDLSLSGAGSANGIILTRPLKFGAPDVLKTVDTVIQRGYFRKGHVQCVLYGSRDLFNWQMVCSSRDHRLRGFRGTPYKYFRLALLCQLSSDERLYGCTVQFTPRFQNRPR